MKQRAKKFVPGQRGKSFRYFAVYRHPEQDTANTLAVSQDKVRVIKLPRRTKDGKRDLTTVESRPIHGACLLKVPFGLALDREMDCEYPIDQLGPRPFHAKSWDIWSKEDQAEAHLFQEFAKAADEALKRNGGGIRHEREQGGAYFGAGL